MSKEVAKQNQSLFAGLTTIKTDDTGGNLEKIEKSSGVAFIAFLSEKSPRYQEVLSALPGIGAGMPYYCGPGGYKRLDNFKFHLLDAAQYFVKYNPVGKPVARIDAKPPGKSDYRETIETLAIAYVDNKPIPCVITFKTGYADAALSASAALKEARTPAWGKRGPEHEASMAIPVPFARVVTDVHVGRKASRDGGTYGVAKGIPRPATIGEAKSLVEALQGADFMNSLNLAKEAFKSRVSYLTALPVQS